MGVSKKLPRNRTRKAGVKETLDNIVSLFTGKKNTKKEQHQKALAKKHVKAAKDRVSNAELKISRLHTNYSRGPNPRARPSNSLLAEAKKELTTARHHLNIVQNQQQEGTEMKELKAKTSSKGGRRKTRKNKR